MTLKKEALVKAHIYSERSIQKYTKYINAKIAEHMRLQGEGKLPFRKRIPKAIVEIGDIVILTGKCERTAQRHMAAIKKSLGKKKGQFVSIEEFCKETGFPERVVRTALNLLT